MSLKWKMPKKEPPSINSKPQNTGTNSKNCVLRCENSRKRMYAFTILSRTTNDVQLELQNKLLEANMSLEEHKIEGKVRIASLTSQLTGRPKMKSFDPR